MNIFKNSRGFTLIELLVVVAIIGLLAAVVIASLNNARAKGADSAIRTSLNSARSQGELYYINSNYSYANICTTATGIVNLVRDAADKISTSGTVGANAVAWAYSTTGAAGFAVCHESTTAWAAMVTLKATSNSGWCVDSTGAGKATSTALAPNTFVCP